MAATWRERILILAKTYPSPSARHIETSCIAGINSQGMMRRLYPVPFRMLENSQQFKKWQWIEANITKANDDHRPESHRIDMGTLTVQETVAPTKEWVDRRVWLEKIPAFSDLGEIEAARKCNGVSLALLRPGCLLALDITKARDPDWTREEREKLLRQQIQGSLLAEGEAQRQVHQLRKIPFDFHYRYACAALDGEQTRRHKIVDWEAGALFWKCRNQYGDYWEPAFRAKLTESLGSKDLMFLMGNQKRFPKQWLIVSLIYPPKRTPVDEPQMSLF